MVTNRFKVSLGISVSSSWILSAPQNENIRQRSAEIETTIVINTAKQRRGTRGRGIARPGPGGMRGSEADEEQSGADENQNEADDMKQRDIEALERALGGRPRATTGPHGEQKISVSVSIRTLTCWCCCPNS